MTEELRTQCEGCGMCCKAVYLNDIIPNFMKGIMKGHFHYNDRHEYTGDHTTGSDYAWAMANLYPLTLEEAYERNPHLRTWPEAMFAGGWTQAKIDKIWNDNTFYGCVNLMDDNRCRIHDNLPRVCSGYPWYSGGPTTNHLFYTSDCYYKRELTDAEKQ